MQNNKKMIYADDLLSALRDDPAINGANLRRVIQHINDANAVDAVVHGRWDAVFEYEDFQYAHCSACCKRSEYMTKFCPNCGAKMDGGNEDA